MYKDYNLHAPKLRDLFWNFYDFLTNSSGCSISAFVIYGFKTEIARILFPLTFQVPQETALTKWRKVPYNILDYEYWRELKSWMLNREYSHWARLNKSPSYTANNESTKVMFITSSWVRQVPSFFLSHQSYAFSAKEKLYLRQKEEGLGKWDVNLLFLLFIEVSGWFGKERGIHFAIIWSTWFICKCWISSMTTEDRV